MHEMLKMASQSPVVGEVIRTLKKKGSTVCLNGVTAGALSFYSSYVISQTKGVHIVVADDRDQAAYLLNDYYALLGEDDVLFFPSAYKRSIVYGREEAECVVMRTSVLSRLANPSGDHTVICTYPEALAELIVSRTALNTRSLRLSAGQIIEPSDLEEMIIEMGFTPVDFVYEPGQYSRRGGILDVFSFSESKPYRIDFFDNEIESIRRFDISSQLSKDKLEMVDIISNVNAAESTSLESLFHFADSATVWFYDPRIILERVDAVRKKALNECEDPEALAQRLSSEKRLTEDLEKLSVVMLRDKLKGRPSEKNVLFSTTPQPKFRKDYNLLSKDVVTHMKEGYRCYLLSDNRAQAERLDNIFLQGENPEAKLILEKIVLHEGFIDADLKACFYTEHQIFDRYQRYKINGEIRHDEQMTIQELNSLKIGDFVTHIDHGVGRFGGLLKIADENGKKREVIKIEYKDGDLLFVNIHSLNRISRYRSGDGEPPKIYKLGGGAWQKLKNATKKAVKDISRQLIVLYAKRKATPGFAFSKDSYFQQELEASFEFEDTPDQIKANEAVKHDMESSRPMDRLVCGDVGFGKTEIAIRAAFKAVLDSKQVAVLVPTTILAMQHYRSFNHRLRDFGVRIEYLNRTKSARETSEILDELEKGKIDILVGTHKILGKSVRFKDLGLLIIDEEQRFGVSDKEKLTQMAVSVDTLTMTATPIPRTLQFSLMGSRDLSVIATPPPNRQPIITETHVFSEELIRDAIEEELFRGGQVYFVHNNVSELQQMQGLITRLCPKARTVSAHGRMKPQEMEKIIMDFIYGEIDVLVSTTIIESGVDIPNVNTIIVNNADRFGLSNLHQLRGRVGRSDRRAYCYLLSRPNELLSTDAVRRLRAIEEFSDLGSGFSIAMQDLDIRGAGNLLGSEQSGFVADLGFETYQKILNEAIAELRNEGLDVEGLTREEKESVEEAISYVSDVQVDIATDASLPESYVHQQAERLKLYREVDSIKDEETLLNFESRLRDRFGKLPEEAQELLNVVRLKREAQRLGMEKVKVKNGLMIVNFVSDSSSPFYQSDIFQNLIKNITSSPDRFVLKQRDDKLFMTIRNVNNVSTGVDLLRSL